MRKIDQHLNKAFQCSCLVYFVGKKLTSLNTEKSNRSTLANISSHTGHEHVLFTNTSLSQGLLSQVITFYYRKEDYDPSPPTRHSSSPVTFTTKNPASSVAHMNRSYQWQTCSGKFLPIISTCHQMHVSTIISSVLITLRKVTAKLGGKWREEINMHRRDCMPNTAQTAFFGGAGQLLTWFSLVTEPNNRRLL